MVARIQSLRETSQHKEWRDFAVLYRANHMAKPFEKALRRANVPYKVSGGQSFFDRAEIKDLCAWFRLWVNNNDDPAFLRAITSPKRGIGHQTRRLSAGEGADAHVDGDDDIGCGNAGSGRGARLPDRLAERHRV